MASRSAAASVALEEARMSAAFSSRSLRRDMLVLDPFLSVDEFHMSMPTFPPHPHAGFSAVTYLFESSPGAFVNRDSLGDSSRIGPGALHWTQAARGMMHEETPDQPGIDCHGLQMFVNLRRADKHTAPRAFHLEPERIPELALDGARIRVLAGTANGVRAPLDGLLTEALLLDVQLAADARAVIEVPRSYTLFALAIAGAGTVDERGAPISALPSSPHRAVGFAHDGDTVTIDSGSQGLHLVMGGGAAIGEPVVFGGPFAMTTPDEVKDAFARYQRGEMGQLAPSPRGHERR